MPVRIVMRHRGIQTTMMFYVGQNAEQNAAAVWTTTGQQNVNTFVNSQAADVQQQETKQAATR